MRQGQQQSSHAYEDVSIVLKSQEQEQFLDVQMKPSSAHPDSGTSLTS